MDILNRIEDMGYLIYKDYNAIEIRNRNYTLLASISESNVGEINTFFDINEAYKPDIELYRLCFEYSLTDINSR